MKRSERYLELDAIRGLAAIAVVFYHYTFRYPKLFPNNFESHYQFSYGNLGVELFFILSGFVIFMSIQKVKSPFEFLTKRFIRLYPTYWIAMIFTFLIVSIFGLAGKEVTINEFLINTTMLQYGLQIPSVDGVYWSLFHELMFYFLMAALFRFIKTKYLILFSLLWLTMSLGNYFFHLKGISLLLNLTYTPLFLGGIYFYKLTVEEKSRVNIIFPIICYIVYFIIIDAKIDRIFTERLIILGFFILFYLNAFNALKFIAIKPLIFLGNISYALYLVHQNMGYIVLNKLYTYFGTYQILIFIPIVLSIVVAYCITEYLEKPIGKYLRKKAIVFFTQNDKKLYFKNFITKL